MDAISTDYSEQTLPERTLRVVIAIPPIYDFYFTPHRFASLGPRIAQTILENLGLKTFFLDFVMEKPDGSGVAMPHDLSHISPYIIENETGPLSFFTRYKRFGLSEEECAEKILAIKPDICFLSCFAFAYAEPVIRLASSIKKRRPGLIIAAAGAGVDACPEYFLRTGDIEYALTGEAEISVPGFVDSVIKNQRPVESTENLWHIANGAITPPYKKVWARNDQIAVGASAIPEKKESRFTLSISRGCPIGCRFCSNHISQGKSFRIPPIDALRKKLDELGDTAGPVSFNIEDDNLFINSKYALEVIKLIKLKFPQSRIFMENGVDYNLLNSVVLDEMISSGFSQFNISLGTISTDVSRHEKRRVDLALYESVVNRLKHHNIPVITYFICGLKDDTISSAASVLSYLAGQPTQAGISLFYPVPGMEGFENLGNRKGLSPALTAGSSAYPWNNSLSTQTMVTAFRLSRLINLSKRARKNEAETNLLMKIARERKLFTFIKEKGKQVY